MKTQHKAAPGAIRRYYEAFRPVVPGMRAKRDVLALLEDRKRLLRAADALVEAALPYGGDPKLRAALDGMRAAIDGVPAR